MTVPPRLNVRVDDDVRAAFAVMTNAMNAPHRRPATVTEVVRAALRIAAETVQARDTATRL